jgi:hypothetical protein
MQPKLFQAADAIELTGLTRHQLREWTGAGRRGLISPDVTPQGPGRHALFSWQTLLVLRLLRVIHVEFAAEAGAWAPAAQDLREKLDHVVMPSLWRTSIVFASLKSCSLVEEFSENVVQGLVLPLAPHLVVFGTKMSIPRPDQLQLFPPMAVGR